MDCSKIVNDDSNLSIGIPSISSINSENTYVISASSSESADSQHSTSEDSKQSADKWETVLNTLNGYILKFCESSLALQRKRDFLLLSVNLIRQNELLKELSEADREDIECYIRSISSRLCSVDIIIGRTPKSNSIDRIDELINSMICFGDITTTRKYCGHYLNACDCLMNNKDDKSADSNFLADNEKCTNSSEKKHEEIGTEFRALLLGCKKKDRENIRTRLWALMDHLNYQICSIVS